MNTPAAAAPVAPVIGIVGLGTVGRALAEALAPRFRVLHSDTALADSAPLQQLAVTCDLLFVCVPTPAQADGAADLAQVTSVVDQLSQHAAAAGRAPLVVIKSTVPPGTTEALAQRHPALSLVACPEFLRQHHAAQDLRNARRVLVGLPAQGMAPAAQGLLAGVLQVLSPEAQQVQTDATTAELVKYATNAFLAIKVTFANQLSDACAGLDVDYAALSALLALDPRIGMSHLEVPGPDGQSGFGGACLPKDVMALLAIAGPQLPLLDAAARWNQHRRRLAHEP